MSNWNSDEHEADKARNRTKQNSRFTPALPKVPKGDTLIAWEQGLDAQIKYQKVIRLEAEKASTNPRHVPNLKISRRYKTFYEEAIQEAKRKNSRRRKHGKS